MCTRGARTIPSLLTRCRASTTHTAQPSACSGHNYRRYYGDRSGWSSGKRYIALHASLPVIVAGYLFKDDEVDDLKKAIGMCTMHLHQAEPDLASPHFEAAFKLVQNYLEQRKDAPVPCRETVFLMDQLGNIALQLERYSEAVQLYMATINGLALNGMERSNRTITELFLKVGQIYAILGDYKLAELSFIHCVEVTTAELSRSTGDKNPDVIALAGLSYEGLGKVYLSMNHPTNALNMYKHAIEFAEKVLGPSDPHLPVLMNDLATVYEHLEQFEAALQCVENAMAKANVSNRAALPVIMCNKATIMMYSGDLEKARTLYEDLLQSCRRAGDQATIREIRSNLTILEDLQQKKSNNG